MTKLQQLKTAVLVPLHEFIDPIRQKQIPAKKQEAGIPQAPGIYAFWWVGETEEILRQNRSVAIIVSNHKGRPPRLAHITWQLAPVHRELGRIPLYIGKTRDIYGRIRGHLKLRKPDWNHPENGTLWKPPQVTDCQFRSGFEHLFKHVSSDSERRNIMLRKIGFSWLEEQDIAERFYLENLAIGALRPWFNVDAER